MNPLDENREVREEIKAVHVEAFLAGQKAVAQQKATEDFVGMQRLAQEAAKTAIETIDLANELSADEDPHKRRLATRIKDFVAGAIDAVVEGRVPAEPGKAIEESPFSENSASSKTSLPTSPKALPSTPPPSPKRKPGRPRKLPQQ